MNPVVDGDQNFAGVDMNTARDSLRPGFVAEAENCRFTNGKIETRKGVSYSRAYCGKGAEFNWSWPVDFNAFASFPVLGIGEFMDPYGEDAVLLLGATHAYAMFEDREPRKLTYMGAPTFTNRIHAVQAFDSIFLFSKGMTPMRWDGNMDVREFSTVTKATGDESITYLDLPQANQALYFGNRLWVPNLQDTIMVSDSGYYNRFIVDNELLLNKGENDQIIALQPFNRTTIIVFKSDSVYAVSNAYGDLSTVRVDLLTSHIGCVSKDAVVTVGSDIHFMSESGIYHLGQVDAERNILNGEPISKPVQPLIDRINFEKGDQIQGVLHQNRIYWAVPLDASEVCNAVIVFDLLTKTFSGMDTFATGASFSIHSWLRADLLGKKRLLAYGNDGFAYAYEETPAIDDIKSGPQHITTYVRTRQYTGGSFMRKNWTNVRAELATLNPSLSVESETVGDGENYPLFTDYTRNRLANKNFGKTVSTDNNDDSWDDPYREDYYVPSETSAVTLNLALDGNLYINTLTFAADVTGFAANQKLTVTNNEFGVYAEVTANSSGTIPASTVVTITHKGATGAEGATENSTGAPSKNIYKVDTSPTPSTLACTLTRCYFLKTGVNLSQVQNYSFPGHLRQQDKAVGFKFTNTQGVLHLRGLMAGGINSERIRDNE